MKSIQLLLALSIFLFALKGEAACPWDLNEDLRVGVEDLLIVLDHYGEGSPNDPIAPWDFNADGRVGVQDILILLEAWGLGDATNPWSCYPYGAPLDASPECITSVFEDIPSCEYIWTENCHYFMCQQEECHGWWCP